MKGEEKYKGLVVEVREFCEKHNLPDPTETPLSNEFVGESIREIARREMWRELVKQTSHNLNLNPHTHFALYLYREDLNNLEKRAIFLHNNGCLNFRSRWSGLHGKTTCPYGCENEDSLSHSYDCRRNPVMRPESRENDKAICDYVLGLHRERMKTFGESLLAF